MSRAIIASAAVAALTLSAAVVQTAPPQRLYGPSHEYSNPYDNYGYAPSPAAYAGPWSFIDDDDDGGYAAYRYYRYGHRPRGFSFGLGLSPYGLNLDLGRGYEDPYPYPYGYADRDPYGSPYGGSRGYGDYIPDSRYGYRTSPEYRYGSPPTPYSLTPAPYANESDYRSHDGNNYEWGPSPDPRSAAPLSSAPFRSTPQPGVPLDPRAPSRADEAVPAPDLRVEASTLAEQQESEQSQRNGDLWLRERNYRNAAAWYQQAVRQAEDRAEPYFQLALAQSALGQYEQAVANIKRGLMLDPDWPATGQTLAEFFGPDNASARRAVVRNVTGWASENPRDADRLFLLGVLLHFDGDRERSAELLAGGLRLDTTTRGEHFRVFLQADPPSRYEQPSQPPAAPASRTRERPRDDFIPPPPVPDEGTPPPAQQRRPDADEPSPRRDSNEEVAPPPAPTGDVSLPEPPVEEEREQPAPPPSANDMDGESDPPAAGPVIPQP